MFLDVIRRRNPRLIEAAIALHQSGQLPANTYVIDLDAVEDNARAISVKANSLGLTVMAMTKQMGRNESFCRAVMRGGINAQRCGRSGMRVGHEARGHGAWAYWPPCPDSEMGGGQRGSALSDLVDGLQCRKSG